MKLYKRRKVSFEAADLDGKARVEDEKVFYGRLTHEALARLKEVGEIEHQQQYQLAKPNGCIRVRRTEEADGDVEYILTGKGWNNGSAKKLEAEQETAKDMFELFKRIADSGMVKTRYTVKDDNGEWEFDVFYDADGNEHEWCKVDLEDSSAGLSEIPITLLDVFEDAPHARTAELQAKVSDLYDNYFTTKGI